MNKIALAIIIIVLTASIIPVQAEDYQTVTLCTSKSTAAVGEEFTLSVLISNTMELYGVSLDITFDPQKYEIVSKISPESFGAVKGSLFEGLPTFQPVNTADNAIGTLSYVELLYGNNEGIDIGTGRLLCTITFKAKVNGPIQLDIDNVMIKLSNSSASPISHNAVFSYEQVGDCNENGDTDIDDLVILSLAFGSTPENARWDSRADFNRDGKVDLDDFLILKSSYGVSSTNIKMTNLAGNKIIKNIDLNHDTNLDYEDIVVFSDNYNSKVTQENWNSNFDINDDLIADIYDMVLVAKYFGVKMYFNPISETIQQYDPYYLPSKYLIQLNNECYLETPVKWGTASVDTVNTGIYTFTGTLIDYNKAVELALTIIPQAQTAINHGNIINLGIVAKQGEYIYYQNQYNNGKLSSAKPDGSSVKKISEDIPFFINIQDGWIYYSNASDNLSIYKIKVDGTGRTKLNDFASEFLNVADGWIYYQNDSDGFKLYKMKIDGSEITKLNDDISLYINVVGDWIYYCNYSNQGEICKISKYGNGKTILNNVISYSLIVDDNWIYYINAEEQNTLFRMKIDGSNNTKITTFSIDNFNISGEWVYFANIGESGRPFKIKNNGSEITRLDSNAYLNYLNIIDSNIFFIDVKDSDFYKMTNDGLTKAVFGQDSVISNIENVKSMVRQDDLYAFPETVLATMSDGSRQYVPVSWNTGLVDTSKTGSVYNFQGVVKEYNGIVTLTVTVIDSANSNGNSINGGIVAQCGEWIYFRNNSDGMLYKIKSDNSGKVRITEDVVSSIHVAGDWIYYIAEAAWNEPRIFKVKTDGTERTMLSNSKTFSFNMMGEWIYYSNYNDGYSLYKVKTDGSSVIKLNNEQSSKINVSSDWIYYINSNDSHSIYKIRADGSQRTKVLSADASEINVYKGYIYYTNTHDGGKIYKVKTDGTSNEKVCDDWALYLNVYMDWIYYSNNSDGTRLYRINIDGTQKTKLVDDSLYCGGRGAINVANNHVYYKNQNDSDKIYQVQFDGSGRQVFGTLVTISAIDDIYVNVDAYYNYTLPETVVAHMSEGIDNELPVTWNPPIAISNKPGIYMFEGIVQGYLGKVKLTLTIGDATSNGNTTGNISNNAIAAKSGDWIYYCTYLDSGTTELHKINVDGTGESVLAIANNIAGLNVADDWIYFLNDSILYRIRKDGTVKTKLIDDFVGYVNLVGDYIYYSNIGNGGFYRVKTDGTQKVKIFDKILQGAIIDNGWIYYEDTELQKIRIDGTGRTSLGIYNSFNHNVVGGYLYYYSLFGGIYRVKTDGTEVKLVVNTKDTLSVNVSGDWIYYTDNYQMYKIHLDGTSKTLISNDNAKQLNIVGDWIYYKTNFDNYTYRLRIDGTCREKLN